MKAISVINEPGTQSAGLLSYQLLHIAADKPELGPHDVLIQTKAAGVNRADLFQAEGKYPAPEGISDILGLEVSGIIIEIGSEVKKLAVGDEVMALLLGGGYAEQVAVAEWRVLSKPAKLSFVEAAAVMEVFSTVYQTLFEKARLKGGEWLLVHGGGSGIGTAAIQLAKHFGVKVAITAGSDEKCQKCIELGANIAINYRTSDFVEFLRNEKLQMNVVLDMVGGGYAARNMKVLAKKGRLVQIAMLHGAKSEVNMAALLMKHLTWIGSTLRSEEEETVYHLMESMRTVLLPLLESGEVKPIIHKVFSWKEAQKAHELMLTSNHFGKIVLEF